MNQPPKYLMKELGEAISQSLSESEQVAEAICRINAEGYDVLLVLEATIGLSPRQQPPSQPSLVNIRQSEAALKINLSDAEFLRAMHISVDD